jgi:DNA-directed RNA polymerase subunit L
MEKLKSSIAILGEIDMQIRKLTHSKTELELEVLGEGETLLHSLREKLLEDKKVSMATYILGHPELENPKLYIKVSKGKPEDALKRALKALIKEYEQFGELVSKVSA